MQRVGLALQRLGLRAQLLERLAALGGLPGGGLELGFELVGGGGAGGELADAGVELGGPRRLGARGDELAFELLGAVGLLAQRAQLALELLDGALAVAARAGQLRLELRDARRLRERLLETLLQLGQRRGRRLELRHADVELLAQLDRLRQRVLGGLALGALGLDLRQRLARLAHRGLGGRPQRGGLLAGRLLLGGGRSRQGVQALDLLGRLLRRALGGRTGVHLLLQTRGDLLRLGARGRQLGLELLRALGVRGDLGAQLAAAGGRVLDGAYELARALLEIGRAALGVGRAGGQRARLLGRLAGAGGLLLGGALELGGAGGGPALDLRRALALAAQAVGRLGERGLGLLALGGDRGRVRLGGLRERRLRLLALGGDRGGMGLGRLARRALALLRGLLERGDPGDEPLGLRARLVELRDVVERAQVLVAQLLELDAGALGELLGRLALGLRGLQLALDARHAVGDLGHLPARLLELRQARAQVAHLLLGQLALVGAGAHIVQLLLDLTQAARRALGALGRRADGDDGLVALALDAARRLEGKRRLSLASGGDERLLVGPSELGPRLLERLRALGGEGLGAGAGVLERARLGARLLELLLGRGGRGGRRLKLGRGLRRLLLGGAAPGERRLRLGLRLLGARAPLRGGLLDGGPRRGRRLGKLLARPRLLTLDGGARLLLRRLQRGVGALGGGLALRAGRLALCLGLRGLLARGAQLGLGARGALLRLRAHLVEGALAVALRAFDRRARGGHLALALGDGRLELRARLALGRVARVELGPRGGDLLAREAGLLLGGGTGLLVEGDALGQRLGLAAAGAQRVVGLRAQARELVAGLARGLLGGAAQPALGLQALLERGHRLAALLGRALGDLAPAALVAQRLGLGPGRRCGRRHRLGRGRRRLALRRPGRGLLRSRQVDDAAARLQREGEMAVAEQRGGRRERCAPRRRVGTGERRRVVGAGQRRQAAGAAAVVEQQKRRGQAFARVRPPAAGDAQQHRAAAGGHALEALNLEFRAATAQRREECRSARAIFASLRTFSGVSSASSTRNRCGSAAASSS